MSLKDQSAPPNLLETAMLASIERLVNQTLRADPAAQQKLANHAGQLVSLSLTLPPLEIHILVVENGVELYHSSDAQADVSIHGGPLELAAELLGWKSRPGIIGGPVRIDGNRELLQSLAAIARELQLDWGAMLEPVIGSEFAAQVDFGARTLFDLARKGLSQIGNHVGNLMREDSSLLALRRDVYEFNQDVDDLRDGVARLEQRIRKLSAGNPNT